MKPLRVILSGCALWLATATPAKAAWCNVFQVCCHSCGHRAVSNYAPDPCCNPCPPVCTTRYVQRCYYQPVTSYETRSYYEPVTTYRTSYSYEPVTSYRYSCYYDPRTCTHPQAGRRLQDSVHQVEARCTIAITRRPRKPRCRPLRAALIGPPRRHPPSN